MKWTVILLALSGVVSSIQGQKCSDGFKSPPFFPDGTPPDLVPVRCRANTQIVSQPETRADCKLVLEDPHTKAEEEDEWRLTRDVIPSHYDLQLDVYVDTFKFNGSVLITINAEKTTEAITLHSDALTIIGSPEIFYNNWLGYRTKWSSVLSVEEDKKHLTVTFHLSKALKKDTTYYLQIIFSGDIRDDLYGFYRSSYTVENKKRWLATTQFEPTHARRAFPCFDEPNLKATFDISITHDTKYKALSNMPKDGVSVINGDRVTDKFQRTQKMSTYLIAFIISDFEEYKNKDEPISSVYASKDFIKDAAYSQKKGVQAVKEMETFTNIRFSLPKIDHVAIPDFAAGAMENWGLITYRDYLLILRNDTNSPTRQYIPEVISHEVAHQWFGNLVTLDWWSYTWLNEGFATFFEYYVTEIITEGKFSMWKQFIPSKFQVALGLDGDPTTSVAMSRKVSTPDDIANKFDQISYGKGGCILRMISELLTLDKFREGLRNYLKEHQFANAKPDGLFKNWEKLSKDSLPKDIKFTDFAKSWTEQDGVPVVTAIRNYETGEVTFMQQRYYDKKPGCINDYIRNWWIPLTWISPKDNQPDNFKPQAWLYGDKKIERLTVKTDTEPGQWLLVNPRSVGYYRVDYDTKNWLLLTKSLAEKPSLFPTENRAQIINDAFFLASSDHLDFAVALETLNFLPQERDTSVWISAIKIISKLVDELGSTEAYPLLDKFGKKILTDVYFTLGLKPEQEELHLKSLLRYYIAPWACNFGVEQCIKDATENLDAFMNDPNSVHPDVAVPILCGAVKGSNEETFWKIRDNIAKVSRMTDKLLIVSALGKCQPDDKLVKRHLEDAMKDAKVIPKILLLGAIHEVLDAPSKFTLGLEFMKENLDTLVNSIGKTATTILVEKVMQRLRTESQYTQTSEWLKENVKKLDDPEKVTAKLEASKANTRWNTLHLYDVADWLAATLRVEPPDSIPTPAPPTPSPIPQNNGGLIKATPFIIATACLFSLIISKLAPHFRVLTEQF